MNGLEWWTLEFVEILKIHPLAVGDYWGISEKQETWSILFCCS